ncbi:MAG: hypothetical protein U9N30_10010 [Campylobacterota bacterium]|nr:hypothetical protein [Campylobacterota bacterium]
MKKIQIKDIELKLDIEQLIHAMDNSQELAIGLDGTIFTDTIDPKMPLMFRRITSGIDRSLSSKERLTALFGKEYKPLFGDTLCIVKPLIAWQEVMKINKDRMFYEDHSSDGIEVFNDERVETVSFEAVVFDIDYRVIAEFIEEHCEGDFVYYENEIQFSGFTIASNNDKAYEQVKYFLQDLINQKVEQGEIDLEQLDEEEQIAYSIIFKN